MSLCPGETITVGTSTYNTAGSFEDILTSNLTGCDSTVRTIVTLIEAVTGNISERICPGSSFFFNGVERTVPGTYLDTVQLATGCDSIVQLSLSFFDPIETDLDEVICFGETFPWRGVELSLIHI